MRSLRGLVSGHVIWLGGVGRKRGDGVGWWGSTSRASFRLPMPLRASRRRSTASSLESSSSQVVNAWHQVVRTEATLGMKVAWSG